jgi:GTPase KRas protein
MKDSFGGESLRSRYASNISQEEYSALRDSYMKTGQGFVLVYDITSATSFDLASKLHTQILRLKEDTPDVHHCFDLHTPLPECIN